MKLNLLMAMDWSPAIMAVTFHFQATVILKLGAERERVKKNEPREGLNEEGDDGHD